MFIALILVLGCAALMYARAIPEDFNFPADVDDPATLPAEVRGLYIKQADGKHVIDPVVRKRMDTSGLNKALDAERKKTKDFEKFQASFKQLGLGETPEEALAAIEAARREADDGTVAGDKKVEKLDELRAKLKAEFDTTLKTELSKKDEQLTKAQRSLQKYMVEKEAVAALAKHKGSQDLLLPHVIGRLGLVEEDGNMVVRVLDKDGDPVGDGMGGFKTVDAFVAEMRADEKYARAFEASGKSGSGTRQGTRTAVRGGDGGQISATDKIRNGLANLR